MRQTTAALPDPDGVWLFTTIGFFSAVADRDDPHGVVVRARVRDDAQALADVVGGEVVETSHTDYRFRVRMPRGEWEAFVLRQAAAIDYDNFKAAVADRQGADRAHVYADVWAVVRELQRGP